MEVIAEIINLILVVALCVMAVAYFVYSFFQPLNFLIAIPMLLASIVIARETYKDLKK